MEELSRSWKKLSLTEKEESSFVMPKIQRKNDFWIAAKFLIPRTLNMDVVGRTFKQVWRCSDGYTIQNMNDHKVLFGFDDERDVNWILMNQPWSFDKHLVVVMQYGNGVPFRSLSFNMVMLWVQVYDIPIRFMTTEVAKNLCDIIGEVVRSIGAETEEGSSFIRVQSKGTLKEEDRQFGPSLKAAPYYPMNQRVIYVPGFFDKSGLEEDEGLKRKEIDAREVAGNKKLGKQTAGQMEMETEEFGEEINAGLNGASGSVTNLEMATKIMGAVIDLEKNNEVINLNNDSNHQEHDLGEKIKEQTWTSDSFHSHGKAQEAREEGLTNSAVGVEGNTLKTRACVSEVFRRSLEEIDTAIAKFDTGFNKKSNGEYVGGDKQTNPLFKDSNSVGQRSGDVKSQVTVSQLKRGKWTRVQTVRTTSMDPLGVVVGKKRSMEGSMAERESNSEVQNKKGRVVKGSE
uniref:DUF4283 domain-containing protein n=1 Tax=Quercus lobata TaxID=97700 RepID=A0A7N2KS50_QUELO